MRMLMVLCIAALLVVFAGCAALDLVLGTNFSEDPVTKEELAEPVAAAAEAAMPKIDPDTGAVTWNVNPVLILSTLVGGVLALVQKRRAKKGFGRAGVLETMVTSMAGGLYEANVPVGVKRTIAATIKRKAVDAGVETGPEGLNALINSISASVGTRK